MTKLEVLFAGIRHIAENHGFKADTECLATDGEVCIWGGCNLPTICDVQLLCEDLGIERECVIALDCGIDIRITKEWMEKEAIKAYRVTGLELWKRSDFIIK